MFCIYSAEENVIVTVRDPYGNAEKFTISKRQKRPCRHDFERIESNLTEAEQEEYKNGEEDYESSPCNDFVCLKCKRIWRNYSEYVRGILEGRQNKIKQEEDRKKLAEEIVKEKEKKQECEN